MVEHDESRKICTTSGSLFPMSRWTKTLAVGGPWKTCRFLRRFDTTKRDQFDFSSGWNFIRSRIQIDHKRDFAECGANRNLSHLRFCTELTQEGVTCVRKPFPVEWSRTSGSCERYRGAWRSGQSFPAAVQSFARTTILCSPKTRRISAAITTASGVSL